MSWFLGGIALLVFGYFTYGWLVERLVAPDDRPTPAIVNPDGVDYVPMSKWRNMLIQLLNIAGTGPVMGVILGIKFGKIALLIIPVGCILMGSVCDFMMGMISLRSNGANLPRIVRSNLGRGYAAAFTWLMLFLLTLCITVFINVPAALIDKTYLPGVSFFWWAIAIIFAYYILATLFPVDKIIGRIYPFFGALLLVGSAAIALALVVAGFRSPEILNDCAGFADFKAANPLFPCLFVTISCGIISGFHSTQSPIVARTMKSEHEARPTFYGMMIAEGVIAMIWASAALALYNIAPENLHLGGPVVLGNVATHFLGKWMGGVTVAAIVVLAITSGDTALRSARLSLAEECSVSQRALPKRILMTLPFVTVVVGMLWWSSRDNASFNHCWNYFAWGNQLVAATALMSASVWLLRKGAGWKTAVTLLPGMFMTTVVVSFILWASADRGQPWGLVWKWADGRLVNCGLPLQMSVLVGATTAVVIAGLVVRFARRGGSRE